MSFLLLGRWDHGGNLVLEDALEVDIDDQEAIDSIVDAQDNEDGMAWASTFLTDTYEEAVREAYETYVKDEGTRIIDETGESS
ncbi:hypothetical protein BJP40_06615 [Streptomyces sp. CC53]|uniref:hypothetical protein n=1 Tax=Streptomyces sp. CC53 TaxID=1906740 RepID=UPI0008DD51AE|nr:hypothetical protein [Streptomyces sp. CC53]OII61195.1 hypothetical protein BJP40_06615 [Streptomyces sp. CC53]